ncbi:hypothetical protein ACJ5W3_002732 [Enterobacter hormaechei]
MSNIDKQALRQTAEKAQEHGVFNMDIHSETVLALLDELEAAENRIAEVESQRRMAFMACNRWGDKFREAEKRIAELEAREVTLPPTFWYDHDDLPREIPVLSRRLVIKALREAGVKVAAAGKGE